MILEPSPIDYLSAYVLAFAWGAITALAFFLLWVLRLPKPFHINRT